MKNWFRFLLYFVNVIVYLVVIALWISIPEELTLNLSTTLFGLALTAGALIIDRERYRNYYNSGHFQKLTSVLLSAFLVFCILGVINYLAFKHPAQVDLSGNMINSLTKKSIEVVSSVKGTIQFKVFARKKEVRLVTAILDLYRFANSDIEVEVIDVELRPDLVSQYEVTASPTTIIEYKGKRTKVNENSELAFTNAIIRITREKTPVIYFSKGHGENAIDNNKGPGLSYLASKLKQSTYDIRSIDIAGQKKLPEDISALVIMGPKSGFVDHELDVIENYLKAHGKILVALDPNVESDKLPGLRELLKRYGMIIDNDFVVDSENHVSGSQGSVPLIKKLDDESVITKGITSNVFFPLVSSIFRNENIEGRFIPIARTTPFPASWAEKTLVEVLGGKVAFTPGVDMKGPIAVMGTFESLDSEGRGYKIVGIGNSSFVANSYAKFTNNFLLFSNSLSWLTNDGELSSFNLPFGEAEPVFISSPQLGIIFYFAVIFVPLILIGLSIFFYRRRRNQ